MRGGVAVSSNFAKAKSGEIGALASSGLITTAIPDGFGRKWRLTSRGLSHLEGTECLD